jgi:hypothetical protein
LNSSKNPEAGRPASGFEPACCRHLAGRTKLELPARCWQHVFRPFGNALADVNSVFAEQLLEAQELTVFCQTIRAVERAGRS